MIAISYRRQDSSPVAGRLYDRLQAEFGKGSVFMDFDSIPYGVDFREHIKQTLKRAKVVVAIIGPEWAGGRGTANRRIDDPTDFVRLEIASALEQGTPIIPVLINNMAMPEANTLPPELEGLAFRNGLALDAGIDFHHHADRLIAGIHKVLGPQAPQPAVAPIAAAPPPPARSKAPLIGALAALLALVGGVAAWYLLTGAPVKTARRDVPVVATTPTAEVSVPPFVKESVAPAATIFAPSASPIAPAAVTTPDTAARNLPRDQVFSGKIGNATATFRLRFDGERVTGIYSQGGKTYRLEGTNPSGKLLLAEYTGERVSAHLDLTLTESPSTVRWDGVMRNTPPDNRVLVVSFERSSR